MEKLTNINYERIKASAEFHETSVEAMFDELKIARATLDDVAANNSGLTWAQLSKIAKHLNRGVLYFMEQGNADQTARQTLQFRSLQNQKPNISRKLRIIIENVERYREIYLTLREYVDLQPLPFAPRQMPTSVEEAASAARMWLKIGNDNSFSKTRLAIEKAGALVIRSNGYNGAWKVPAADDVLGFSLFHELCPVIFIRKQDSEARQLFTLAHELGHLLLHRDHFIDGSGEFSSNGTQERDANQFAGYFLVPQELLEKIDLTKKPDHESRYVEWLRKYSNKWGVSTETILRRLLDEEMIGSAEYNAFRKWQAVTLDIKADGGSRMYRHREPKHLFGEVFVSAVIQSLRENKISLVQASQYLDNIKAEDVRKLEHHYAGL